MVVEGVSSFQILDYNMLQNDPYVEALPIARSAEMASIRRCVQNKNQTPH